MTRIFIKCCKLCKFIINHLCQLLYKREHMDLLSIFNLIGFQNFPCIHVHYRHKNCETFRFKSVFSGQYLIFTICLVQTLLSLVPGVNLELPSYTSLNPLSGIEQEEMNRDFFSFFCSFRFGFKSDRFLSIILEP